MTIAIIGALLCTAFTGCGKKNDVADNKTDEPVAEQTVDNSKADETEAESVVEKTEELTVKEQFLKKCADNEDVIARYENDKFFNWDTAFFLPNDAYNPVCSLTLDEAYAADSSRTEYNLAMSVEPMDATLTFVGGDDLYETPLYTSFRYVFNNVCGIQGATDFKLQSGTTVHVTRKISTVKNPLTVYPEMDNNSIADYYEFYECEVDGVTGYCPARGAWSGTPFFE